MNTLSYFIASLTAVQAALFRGSTGKSTFVLNAMVQGEERPIYLRYGTMEYNENTVGFYNILEAQSDVADLSDYPYNCTLPNLSPVAIQWQYDASMGKLRVMNAAALIPSSYSPLYDATRKFCLTITSDSDFYSIDDCSASHAPDHIRRTIEYPAWVEYSRNDKKGEEMTKSCMGFKSYYHEMDPYSFDQISAKCYKAGGDIHSYFFKENINVMKGNH